MSDIIKIEVVEQPVYVKINVSYVAVQPATDEETKAEMITTKYVSPLRIGAWWVAKWLSLGINKILKTDENGVLTSVSITDDSWKDSGGQVNGGQNSHADSGGFANADNSHADSHSEANGIASHADSYGTTSGQNSHADSSGTASGNTSHADSSGIANGQNSHADSYGTASGNYSHADSYGTASGNTSHADSSGNTLARFSHANCKALIDVNGENGFASGDGVIIRYKDQKALGKYNANDANNIFEIGNGTDTLNRSNCFAVGFDGLSNVEKRMRTIALTAYAIDLFAGEDFTKTCGTSSQFTISNAIIKKCFRLIISGGTLSTPIFNGYTSNWIYGSVNTDYSPAITNYLYCEIRSAGQIYLFWGS